MTLSSFSPQDKSLSPGAACKNKKRIALGDMAPTCSSDRIELREAPQVDLVDEALRVQHGAAAYREPEFGCVKLIAPAKVNLFLSIGDRRPDGFHEALSILHTLSLHDTLYVRRIPQQDRGGLRIRVHTIACEGLAPLNLPSEKNIVFRAIRDLAQCVGRSEHELVEVYLEKHIPSQAGLGGGSSDAAAALVAAAYLWGIPQNDPHLERAARKLGSDVPFFLRGGCARFGDRGNVYEGSLKPFGQNLVLIKPGEGVSTAEAYREFDAGVLRSSSALVSRARSATAAGEVPLFNNLAQASERLAPRLLEIRAWALQQEGVTEALLCGSGSTTFVLCDKMNTACRVAARAQHAGFWSRVTFFSSLRVTRVPIS